MSSTLYSEDELLMLSGIQHYCYCPRQWALAYMEQLWEDNQLTSLGQVLHERVNKPEETERRRDTITLRSVPLASYQLGLYGLSDAVELRPAPPDVTKGFTHPKYPGLWTAIPIEYKRGKPKKHNADRLQLCAEAICLEEMYGIEIPLAYLYYGEIKHREEVILSPALRAETQYIAHEMHRIYSLRQTPKAEYNKGCRSCSLIEQCMPLMGNNGSVKDYYAKHKLFK